MEDTLQDALKTQSSLLPWRKALDQPCNTSLKMTVRDLVLPSLSNTPSKSHCLLGQSPTKHR